MLSPSSPSNLRGLSNLSNQIISATSNLRVGAVALGFAPTAHTKNAQTAPAQNKGPHMHDVNELVHMNQTYQMN